MSTPDGLVEFIVGGDQTDDGVSTCSSPFGTKVGRRVSIPQVIQLLIMFLVSLFSNLRLSGLSGLAF